MKLTPTQLRWIKTLSDNRATPATFLTLLYRWRFRYLLLGLFCVVITYIAYTIHVYFMWAAVGYSFALLLVLPFADILKSVEVWPVQSHIIDWQRVEEIVQRKELPSEHDRPPEQVGT